MLTKGYGKLKSSFLPFFFVSLFVSLNAYADDTKALSLKAQAQDQAIEAAQEEFDPSADDYRQRLRRTVSMPEEYFPNEIDYYMRYVPSRGASSQSGSVAITDSGAEYSYELKAFGKLPVQFGVSTEYIGVKNSTAVQLPAYLTSTSFGVETTLPFFGVDKTYFTLALAPTISTDNWNFRSSAFSLLQRYFLIHQPNEKWTFICGAAVWPGYEDEVLPIVGFIYKPNDKWTFNIIPKGPEISYAMTEKLTVFGEGDMSGYEFVVTQDDHKNVRLEYNEIHAGGGLRYKPNKNVNASVSIGGMFNRSLKYRPDSLGKVVIKDGLYSAFRLELYF
ncbi:MAG: DUF6268 family outer membrane beta-barrel protein [Candidatus Omnitrophota bacterium]